MNIPVATYRIQLNRDFDFSKVKNILEYLSQLGISHVYASPVFKTRRGSPHGYAITDMNQISDELGGVDAFRDLIKEASSLGIEWLQDIVPNHVAYTPENRMIADIMRYGSGSRYHGFFDVDWNHKLKRLKGKLLAPFLLDSYENCLRTHQLGLVYHDGFAAKYGELEFPLRLNTYEKILRKTGLGKLVEGDESSLPEKLQEEYTSDEAVRNSIDASVQECNNDTRLLDEILSCQAFALDQWREALKHINYRRFFDVIDLICLRNEQIGVFEETHKLILNLLAQGKVSGLRADHIDGLHDPKEYLERLRERAPDTYVLVEKILMNGEELPDDWRIEGSTGYDFLNAVNEVFVDGNHEAELDKNYVQFTGNRKIFDDFVRECKKKVILRQFSGDVENMAQLLMEILREHGSGSECNLSQVTEAIIELLCSFPVYRTYFTQNKVDKRDVECFESAMALAKRGNEKARAALEMVDKLFRERNSRQDLLHFVMRLQQFTGAIMAKGLEDTAFYVYNRLISLNEVGSNPAIFGTSVDQFHAFNKARVGRWLGSLNATATHDTKRGEDVRARLNVLSEIPSEWASRAKNWAELNRHKKKKVNSKLVPSRNEEYYLYQTVIGAFPFDHAAVPDFVQRLKAEAVKAIREAKISSSWLNPDVEYEEAAKTFVADLFEQDDKNGFLEDFLPFHEEVASYGFVNSLSQTLLKMTCPGVPDFYQGAELWDLNLVDPDNRRAVDFEKRKRFMKEILGLRSRSVESPVKGFGDGRVKLYEIVKALKCRKMNKEFFEQGAYIPLEVKGIRRNYVISFCRKRGNDFALVVVPRLLATMNGINNELDGVDWTGTFVCLPRDAPRKWVDVFTGKGFSSSKEKGDEGFHVEELLGVFPVAFLLSGDRRA